MIWVSKGNYHNRKCAKLKLKLYLDKTYSHIRTILKK